MQDNSWRSRRRLLRVAASSNQALNRTAQKLRFRIPSALRAPAPGWLCVRALSHTNWRERMDYLGLLALGGFVGAIVSYGLKFIDGFSSFGRLAGNFSSTAGATGTAGTSIGTKK